MIICPTCGAENSDEQAYCHACGVALPVEPAWRCRNCGAVNPLLNATCQECGDLYEPLAYVEDSGQDKDNGYRRESQAAPQEPQSTAAAPEAEVQDEAAADLSQEAGEGIPDGREPAVPAWLAEIATETAYYAEPGDDKMPSEEGQPEAETPGAKGSESEATSDEIPAWLEALSPQPGPSEPDLFQTASADPDAGESAPGMGLEGEKASRGQAEAAASTEIPEWLKDAGAQWAEEAGQDGERAAEPGEETQSAAPVRTEIPEWLKTIQSGGLMPEESVGPLAGVRGVLPAEPIIAAPHLATAVPGLIVTDEQAAQVAWLESILAAKPEPWPEPAPGLTQVAGRPSRTAQIERWAIALVLLVAIVVPLLLQPRLLPAPAPTLPAQAAFQVIEGLRPGGIALVAFDYDPASAGELDPLALTVLHHLAGRNVRVLALSTRPLGPALAQQALDTVAAEGGQGANELRYGEWAVNLGYLPGGPVGLNALALNPAIMARDYRDGTNPWAKPAASGLVSLAQVQVLVVLSADPASLRDWIEQVGVAFPNLPIIAGTSAASEPLARPYYEGHQVKGLVAGLPGADSYEHLSGRAGEATTRRDAQGLAQTGAVLILLSGAMVIVAAKFMQRRAHQEQKGES